MSKEKKYNLKKKIYPILRSNKVSYCALFGSRARGDYKRDSDYDFLIDFVPGSRISLFDVAQLKLDLESKLKKDVDVVSRRSIKPMIRAYAQKDLLKIYEKRQ